MLIRCDVTPTTGLSDLHVCRLFGDYFAARGYRIGYAINRDGYESARTYLGESATIHRLADGMDEELERMARLQRKHEHQILFVNSQRADSAWLFRMHQRFNYTIVYDQGSSFLIYANLVINPDLKAHQHRYNCDPQARLLLGPKFHICDPQPLTKPEISGRVDQVLVHLGETWEHLTPVLEALGRLNVNVDVLCSAGGPLEARLESEATSFPHCKALTPATDQPFSYHDYPLIVTLANRFCLELAHMGLVFVNLAISKDQLGTAYVLEQLGASPTLGWRGSKKVDDIADLLDGLVNHPLRRAQCSKAAMQMVDGKGLERLTHFVPAETVPVQEPLEQA